MFKEYDVQATIIYGLQAERTAKQISEFNNIPQQTVYNMKKVYDAENNVTPEGKNITSAKIAQIQRSSTKFRKSSIKIPESQCAALQEK